MTFSEADPLPGAELAAFVAAVESGTIQGAADALALTQSAATKRIQRLEARAGAVLLHRVPRGVVVTPLGETLLPRAREALAALAHAGAALEPGSATRELPICASQTPGEFLLPGWLAGFRATAPEVRVRLDVVNSPAVIARVREGSAEIGFVEGLDALDGLEVLSVARDRLVVVVDAGHRWARRRRIRPAELAGEPYFAREEASGTRAVADRALAEVGISLNEVMSLSSVQALKRAIAGGGFTIISELAVRAELTAGGLVTSAVDGVDFSRHVQALRRPRGPHSRPARTFWTWLASRAVPAPG